MTEPNYDLIKTSGWGEDEEQNGGEGEIMRQGWICDEYFKDFSSDTITAAKYGFSWGAISFEIKYVKAYPTAKRLVYCPNSLNLTYKNLTTNVEQTIGIDSDILAVQYGIEEYCEFSQDTLDKTWCIFNGGEGDEIKKGLKIDDVYNVETAETITCGSKEYVSCILVGKGEITISSNIYSVNDYYFIAADTSVDIEVSDNTSFIRFSND